MQRIVWLFFLFLFFFYSRNRTNKNPLHWTSKGLTLLKEHRFKFFCRTCSRHFCTFLVLHHGNFVCASFPTEGHFPPSQDKMSKCPQIPQGWRGGGEGAWNWQSNKRNLQMRGRALKNVLLKEILWRSKFSYFDECRSPVWPVNHFYPLVSPSCSSTRVDTLSQQ